MIRPPASALADVLLLHGRTGVLSPPLHQVSGRPRAVSGVARTVTFERAAPGTGGTFDELYALLDEDLDGAVLVIGGAENVEGAVWGQILGQAAERAGAAAVLIAGYTRDHAELRDSPLPLWARGGHTMGATGRARVVAIDAPLAIDTTRVEPGDTVVVDAGGAVCLAQSQCEELIEHGMLYASAEQRVLDDLEAGVPLAQAYSHKRGARAQILGR